MSEPAFETLAALAIYNVAPADLGRSRYVRANDTWYEAMHEGMGLDRWEARRTGTVPILARLQSGSFLGFADDELVLSGGPVTVPATVGNVSLPGPAAGYIRVIYQLSVIPTTATSAQLELVLQPGSKMFRRSFTAAVTAGTTRVEIIPAALTGYYNRLAWFGLAGGQSPQFGGPKPGLIVNNDDATSHQIEGLVGDDVVVRSGAVTTLTFATAGCGGLFEARITTLPLKLALRAAQNTRPVQVFACYKTYAIAA